MLRRSILAQSLVLSTAAAALLGATTAQASVMATAPAYADSPVVQTIYCDIVNLNTTPKNVTIEVMDEFGAVVAGPANLTLLPDHGAPFGDSSGNGAWCRFTVDGSAKNYRAMAAYDNGSAYTIAVPAK